MLFTLLLLAIMTQSTCPTIPRNQLCVVSGTATDGTMTLSVGDLSDTTDLQQISAAGGITGLSLQMLNPAALPAKNVRFLLVGEVHLINEVTNPVQPAVGIPVQSLARVNLRVAPSLDAAVVGAMTPDDTRTADALSQDRDWVRVGQAWISREWIAPDPALETLPRFDPRGPAAFQHIRLLPGTGGLLIQVPIGMNLPLRVNETWIEVNNTVVLDFDDRANLRLTALDGGARFDDDVRLPRGFSTVLADNGWLPPRPMSQSQLDDYMAFETLPAPITSRQVDVPDGAFIRPGEPATVPLHLLAE